MSVLTFKTPTPLLRSRTYYFRLRIPTDLLAVYSPRKELTCSLKTQDYKEALQRVRLKAIELDQEFREHRARLAAERERMLASAACASSSAHAPTACAVPPAALRPFAHMPDHEKARLLTLYQTEAMNEAEQARTSPPPGDEDKARQEWQDKEDIRKLLEGDAFRPQQPPLCFPPSAAYMERLKGQARLFLEAAPLYLTEGDISPMLDKAEAFLQRHSYAMPTTDDTAETRAEFRSFCLRLMEMELQVQRIFLGRLEGEPWAALPAPPLSPVVNGAGAMPVLQTTLPQTAAVQVNVADPMTESDENPRLSKVFEMYLAEKGRSLSVGTVVEFRLSTRRFMEFAGDLPIQAYNKRQHIIRFKDALLKLPTRLPRRLQQMTLPEILKRLERERGEERQTLTAVTVNSKYLSALHTVFEYAIANGILENNPCSGVKAVNQRLQEQGEDAQKIAFSGSDLRILFQESRLYHKDKTKGRMGNLCNTDMRSKLEEYRWFVLLALFTGARIEELGQLDKADVKEEQGVWYIHIHGDMSTNRRVKNASSVRKVPLHKKLLEMGFLAFAQRTENAQRRRRNRRNTEEQAARKLFASFSPDRVRGRTSHAFSRWFTRFLDSLELEDRQRKSFHSFRHTFKRDGRNTEGMPPEILDALQGHAQQGVAARYGRDEEGGRYALPVLKRYLDMIDFGRYVASVDMQEKEDSGGKTE